MGEEGFSNFPSYMSNTWGSVRLPPGHNLRSLTAPSSIFRPTGAPELQTALSTLNRPNASKFRRFFNDSFHFSFINQSNFITTKVRS